MDHVDLDRMIERLEDLLPAKIPTFSKAKRGDWRGFWDQVKVVQAGFKSGVRYPSAVLRQAAWERFGALCSEAKSRQEAEHDALTEQSKDHRWVIMDLCSGIKYSPLSDAVFFFDKTTVNQMKTWSLYLRNAMNELKERKHYMTGQHKQECFDRIQEVKESHELFWAQHKKGLAARQDEWEAKQRLYASKKDEFRSRLEANIRKNQEALRRAVNALEKVQAHAADTREKISDASSVKWVLIYSEWLAEDEKRTESIEESIKRIIEWIEEDKRKLREMD